MIRALAIITSSAVLALLLAASITWIAIEIMDGDEPCSF